MAGLPRATYRLQLTPDFGFADAAALVPYLDRLGVSHLYLSPVFAARPGSPHGYDVVDPTRLNPALGGEQGFGLLAGAAADRGLGLILDIVPNHMAAHWDNLWWRDILEYGARSPYAGYLDVWWDRIEGRIPVPVLGSPLAEVLARGELQLELFEEPTRQPPGAPPSRMDEIETVVGGAIALRYHEHRFPLRPGTWASLLEEAVGEPPPGSPPGSEASRRRLAGVLTAVEGLGPTPERAAEEKVKTRLRAALEDPDVWGLLAGTIARWNHDAGRIAALVGGQAYEPAHHGRAGAAPGYRRFFDISHLVGVRVEDPGVFATTHRLILQLLEEGLVQGLRIDHVDGLRDPSGYLRRLASEAGRRSEVSPLLLVEKILGPDESLPTDWPVDGTTGYESLNRLNHCFVRPEGLDRLDRLYRTTTGETRDFGQIVYEAKREVLQTLFAGDVAALAARITGTDPDLERAGVDAASLRAALVELTACLDVYRTYTVTEVRPEDRARIHRAADNAQRRNPGTLGSALAYLRRLLTLEQPAVKGTDRQAALEIVAGWQQLSGPAMAKGLEDTAFYRFHRLLSLNEVGGEAEPPAQPLAHLHAHARHVLTTHPGTLSPGTTHDTKRSEDARCRLDVLSHAPERWEAFFERWEAEARPLEHDLPGTVAPSPADRHLILQTLVAIWPANGTPGRPRSLASTALVERVEEYLVKALREGKLHSSWLSPNRAYEDAVLGYARGLLEGRVPGFIPSLDALVAWMAPFGALVSLAQTAVRLTAPGVPDIYRGSELWDHSLVDPDNRRPVDFSARRALLDDLDRRAPLPDDRHDGAVKLALLRRLLGLRCDHEELFRSGAYLPLRVDPGDTGEASGGGAQAFLAFARRRGDTLAVTLVPRFPGAGDFRVEGKDLLPRFDPKPGPGPRLALPAGPAGAWWDVLEEGPAAIDPGDGPASVAVADLLRRRPLAVLLKSQGNGGT